jgi:hypothetical protein
MSRSPWARMDAHSPRRPPEIDGGRLGPPPPRVKAAAPSGSYQVEWRSPSGFDPQYTASSVNAPEANRSPVWERRKCAHGPRCQGAHALALCSMTEIGTGSTSKGNVDEHAGDADLSRRNLAIRSVSDCFGTSWSPGRVAQAPGRSGASKRRR